MNDEITRVLASYVSSGKISIDSIKDENQKKNVIQEIEDGKLFLKRHEEQIEKKRKAEEARLIEFQKRKAEFEKAAEERRKLLANKANQTIPNENIKEVASVNENVVKKTTTAKSKKAKTN